MDISRRLRELAGVVAIGFVLYAVAKSVKEDDAMRPAYEACKLAAEASFNNQGRYAFPGFGSSSIQSTRNNTGYTFVGRASVFYDPVSVELPVFTIGFYCATTRTGQSWVVTDFSSE